MGDELDTLKIVPRNAAQGSLSLGGLMFLSYY